MIQHNNISMQQQGQITTAHVCLCIRVCVSIHKGVCVCVLVLGDITFALFDISLAGISRYN